MTPTTCSAPSLFAIAAVRAGVRDAQTNTQLLSFYLKRPTNGSSHEYICG
jgi:hypothetical protein